MTRALRTSSASGLSTLEALVAVAVLGLALIPILAFQTQIGRAYERYETLNARSQFERNALAVLRDINPMEHPAGQLSLGPSQTVIWTSHALTRERLSTAYPAGDGEFVVALFLLEVQLEDRERRQEFRMDVERLGWRRSVVGASQSVSTPGP